MTDNRNHCIDPLTKSLIEKYFDGLTTIEEERLLRRRLAESDDRSPETEAARAVLGIFAAARVIKSKKVTRCRQRHRYSSVFGAVASVAVLLIATFAFSGTTEAAGTGKCYASVGGRTIDDRNAVEALVVADFASISEASRSIETSITDDLSMLGNSINPI